MTNLLRRRIDVPRRWSSAFHFGRTPGGITASFVVVGVVLRLVAYAHGRPYWLDEQSLLANLEGVAPFELLLPMRGGQLAPPGFVAVQRLVAAGLGGSPYALRLVPLVAGIGAMIAFRPLAMRALDGPAVPIAVGLFALSDDLIYYSAELKPYILDVAAAVVALWFGIGAIEGRQSAGERAAALVFGLAAPWLAFASGALLPAVALAWAVSAATRKDLQELARAIGSGTLWAASGLGSLAVAHVMLATNDHVMDRFWAFAFVPIPPSSLGECEELLRHALNIFGGPGRVALPFGPAGSAACGLILAAVGVVLMMRDLRWFTLSLLLMPGFLHALASSAHLYPFHGRMILYLAPSMLLLISRTIGMLWRRASSPSLRVALLVVVFVVPVGEAVRHLVASHQRGFDPHGDLRPDPF